MITEEEEWVLRHAITRHPFDPLPCFALADWLEENGRHPLLVAVYRFQGHMRAIPLAMLHHFGIPAELLDSSSPGTNYTDSVKDRQ